MANRVLIIDDDEKLLKLLSASLEKEGFVVSTAAKAEEGLERFREIDFDVCMVDLVLPDMDGIELLKVIRNIDSNFPVIMITGHATIDLAVKAMRMGAFYFIEKPASTKAILEILKRAIEQKELILNYQSLKKTAEEKFSFSGIIGKSKQMQEIFELIERIATAEATVLIQGESGTGKELVAKAIHFNSQRKENRFVAINCSALPETLLESELFGYERGAFTGATKKKKGLFEISHKGTIFLDEIVETSPAFQSKLLRVLEEKTFYPVGSTEERKSDVRILAATNRNIEDSVAEGQFRKDLYYRLNVVKILLPPLRDRKIDIPLLTQNFLTIYSEKNRKDIKGVSDEAMEVLMRYSWPGNVRELENAIERAVILCQEETIRAEHLPERTSRSEELEPSNILEYEAAKEAFERRYLRNLLKQTGGNVTDAARISQMTRQNIYLKLKKYEINPKVYYPRE
ncbi:MAG: sigma-54 dependent transcriptional regulator [candidate division WOR-3 bacterium]|jgi:DNA-binding NtrC family response regulator